MDILNNKQDCKKMISFFTTSINTNINILIKHKKILTQYGKKLSDYYSKNANQKDNVKHYLSLVKGNIALAKDNITLLKDFKQKVSNITEFSYEVFNEYMTISKKVSKDISKIDDFLVEAMEFTTFSLATATETTDSTENVENIESTENIKDTETEIVSSTSEETTPTESSDIQIVENTLIISENKKTVTLPYTINKLEDTLKNNSDKYSNIEDVISTDYTLPLSSYKNTAIARFKEAFNLVMNRGNGNLKQAIDLALELFFNSNLHPAIISACKDQDELDIYLDYLENGETNKFSCFNVIFDVAPIIVKNNKNKRSQSI